MVISRCAEDWFPFGGHDFRRSLLLPWDPSKSCEITLGSDVGRTGFVTNFKLVVSLQKPTVVNLQCKLPTFPYSCTRGSSCGRQSSGSWCPSRLSDIFVWKLQMWSVDLGLWSMTWACYVKHARFVLTFNNWIYGDGDPLSLLDANRCSLGLFLGHETFWS